MKIFNGRIPLLGAVILASTLLSGCPSGSSDTNNTGSTPSAVKVTASLGRFSVGTVVNLKKLDGTPLGTGSVIDDGTATVNIDAAYTGPVVVEVVGGTGVTYFDEKTKGLVSFAAGKTLRSAMPAVQANVGVTPLTNAAVAKLEAAGGTLATSDASKIQTANLKLAQVFGLTDILTPPNPVNSTGATLDLAKEADKYALVLAALANTATAGSDAAAVSAALALDLKDDKLDGLDATSATPAATLDGYVPANIATQYQVAAGDYATAASIIIAADTPIVITTDVSTVAVVTNQSDVTLAKAMFTDLRSTAFSLSNVGKSGFLDIQSAAIAADTLANAGPDMQKSVSRMFALGNAAEALKDRNAYTTSNTLGFAPGCDPNGGCNTLPATMDQLARQKGTVSSAMFAWGSDFSYCWSAAAATLPTATMSCISASAGSGVITGTNTGYMRLVQLDITETAARTYSYVATRKNMPVTYIFPNWTPTAAISAVATLPVGKGTFTTANYTTDANGWLTGTGTLAGTMPPSTANLTNTAPLTGLDHINISVTRTPLATPANSARFDLVGTVSSDNLVDASITNATFSFDNGTYVSVENSSVVDAYNKTITNWLGGKVIGTYKTAASQFTGTIDLGASVRDASNTTNIIKNATATGTISDISTGGVGDILTGTVVMTLNNPVSIDNSITSYNDVLPTSASNYLSHNISFTGTIQQPNLPVLSLTLANTRDSYDQNTTAINYAFGTKTITGSTVSLDSATTSSVTMNINNQDGIQFSSAETNDWTTFPSTQTTTATLTKSGTPLATSINMTTGVVNYIDGTSATIY